jgi:hypothetical protein
MRRVVAVCVALAALSLLLPSQPTYDPWAWLIWGREIAFLDLNTHGGPSWKPLPVIFTTVFSPFGKINDGIPPDLWLVVARAGGLLALYFAFKVAARLAGPDRRLQAVAGVVAAGALLLSPQWLRYLAHGNEAPMAVGLLLWAADRHLDGRRDHALVLAFLACLLRPEVFPFLAIYCVVVWLRERRLRWLVVGLLLALPVLWLVPEWIGSGDPLSAGEQARSEPSWSLSLRDKPWLQALKRANGLAGLELELGALAAVVIAAVRRDRNVLVVAGAAVGWLAVVAAMTQAGFSGNPRYFLPALVLTCVLAGIGAAWLIQLAPRPWARILVGVLLAVLVWPYTSYRVRRLDGQAHAAAARADLQRDLARAIQRVGGPDKVNPQGVPRVNRSFATRVAWELKIPMNSVRAARKPAPGILFTAKTRYSGEPPLKSLRRWKTTYLTRVGNWKVYRAAPLRHASRSRAQR